MFLANPTQTKKDEKNVVKNIKLLQIQDEKTNLIGLELLFYYCKIPIYLLFNIPTNLVMINSG